jgi:hypothetical protein
MPKRLRATRISNRLASIFKDKFYCYEAHEGQNDVFENWHCPYFEGRINRAPITQRWGRCHYLGVTETVGTRAGAGLLWDQVKHSDCPETPSFSLPK